MSSVNVNGRDYKRCMRCAEWTDYADLLYVPPTRPGEYTKAEDDRLYDASKAADHQGEAWDAYLAAQHAWFGLDVCPACGVHDAHRAPMITIHLR